MENNSTFLAPPELSSREKQINKMDSNFTAGGNTIIEAQELFEDSADG